jgi:hypothetical protein
MERQIDTRIWKIILKCMFHSCKTVNDELKMCAHRRTVKLLPTTGQI